MRSLFLLAALLALLPGSPALADGPGMQRLRAVLSSGQAESLDLTWTQGLPGAEQKRLILRSGSALLSRCAAAVAPGAPSCSDVGAPARLTAGQRDRLLSGLRALGLDSLRSAGPAEAASADRGLILGVDGLRVGTWQLSRQAWPAPPGGDSEGLAAFLDELAEKRLHSAQARLPVPIPATAADLSQRVLKLHITPRARPGGVLVIEHGVAHVTPEEGTERRVPRPVPWERPLSAAEQDRLVHALSAAALDRLETEVPRREAPAIGDTDGRLCTLHLLPQLDEETRPAGTQGPRTEYEPRGIQRFLTDLLRSPAAPLLADLLEVLTTPPARKRR